MSKIDINKLKSSILKTVRFDLSYEFGFTNNQIDELLAESELEKCIEDYPAVYAHMTSGQIIDVVLG